MNLKKLLLLLTLTIVIGCGESGPKVSDADKASQKQFGDPWPVVLKMQIGNEQGCHSRPLLGGDDLHTFDQHRLDRNIMIRRSRSGFDKADFIHNLNALNDLAKNCVTSGGWVVIKTGVVLHIDEELRCGRIRIRGSGHGNGASRVGKPITGLVDDGLTRRLGLHVGRHAACLNHEVTDDAMENRSIVKAILGIADEVLYLYRRIIGEKFKRDFSQAGVDNRFGIAARFSQ